MDSNDVVKAYESDYDGLFGKFLSELVTWSNTGKEPELGDQNIKYSLDLEEARLKKYNLEMKLDIDNKNEMVIQANKIAYLRILEPLANAKFKQSLHFQPIHQQVEYVKNNHRLSSRKQYVMAYQTIIEADDDDDKIAETAYNCPNCGAIAKVKELQQGCTYCHTRFIMSELYPKVTNYYTLDNTTPPSRTIEGNAKISLLLGGFALFAINLYNNIQDISKGKLGIFLAVLYAVLSFFTGALLGYMAYSLSLLAGLLRKAFKSLPLAKVALKSPKKMTEEISKYDPSFSYEYFEGRALSIAKIILFHDQLGNCVQYAGKPVDGSFSKILHVEYRGGIGFHSIKRVEDKLIVIIDLYLTNTYNDGRNIKYKDETMRLTMYHNTKFEVDPVFSIQKVQCFECGASFDATKNNRCPFCGADYSAEYKDWVATNLVKV